MYPLFLLVAATVFSSKGSMTVGDFNPDCSGINPHYAVNCVATVVSSKGNMTVGDINPDCSGIKPHCAVNRNWDGKKNFRETLPKLYQGKETRISVEALLAYLLVFPWLWYLPV